MDNGVVEVVSSKVGISICRKDLKNPFTDFQNGNIKCSTTEVEDSDFFIAPFIKTIGKGCSCWLGDNPFDIKACNSAGIFCCLSL